MNIPKELCDKTRSTVDEHDRILKGNNGTPGLMSQVWLNTDFRKNMTVVLTGVTIALIGAIITQGFVIKGELNELREYLKKPETTQTVLEGPVSRPL